MKKMLWVFWIGLAFGCGEDSSPEGPASSNNTIQTNNQSTTPDACVPSAGGIELCDGIDNDCDGEIDEDYTEIGDSCTAGVGVCTTDGTLQCSEDQLGVSCIPNSPIEPSDEVCDGLDNDCDGEVDETFTLLGSECSVGDGECPSSGIFICSEDGTSEVCNSTPALCPPEPTTLSVSTSKPKTFLFEWDLVPGANEFRVLERLEAGADYELVATLPATEVAFEYYTFLPDKVNATYVVESCNLDGCVPSSEVGLAASLNEAIGYLKASNMDAGDFFGFTAISDDGSTLAVGAPQEASASTGINGNQSDNSSLGRGAVYIFQRDGDDWQQQAYIKPSDAASGFGLTIALSGDGNTLAVGSSSDKENFSGVNGSSTGELIGSGAAYVFSRNGNTWAEAAKIKASNPDEYDGFGGTVSLSNDGNTLVVGATGEGSSSNQVNGDQNDNTTPYSGAAYVFSRNGSVWTQSAYLKPSHIQTALNFGSTVGISGDGSTIGVTAINDRASATGVNGIQSDDGLVLAGAVYVFQRTGGSWAQEAYIKPSNTHAEQEFGIELSFTENGNILAVGASGENSGSSGINISPTPGTSPKSGAVYVFSRNGLVWSQEAYIKASFPDDNDYFGARVSISDDGTRLVVGSADDSDSKGFQGVPSDNSAEESGAVYLFAFDGSVWSETGYLKAPNNDVGDSFGFCAVSGDGQTIAVGAVREGSNATGIGGDQSDNSAPDSGAVYLY